MGVYINMEMPVLEHQSWDIRKGADGKWYVVDTNAETSDGEWHEIVPVPAHGRLIDADSLEMNYLHIRHDGMKIYTQRAIDNAPTIIPVSKEE